MGRVVDVDRRAVGPAAPLVKLLLAVTDAHHQLMLAAEQLERPGQRCIQVGLIIVVAVLAVVLLEAQPVVVADVA